jgi:methyl-accepting chemotaxis protein
LPPSHSSLDAVRLTFSRAFVGFLWLNGVIVAIATLWRGTLPLAVTIVCVGAVAGASTWLAVRQPYGAATRVVSSMALAGLVALLVAVFRPGGEARVLQLDMHMYFFACLPIVAAWLDWRPSRGSDA